MRPEWMDRAEQWLWGAVIGFGHWRLKGVVTRGWERDGFTKRWIPPKGYSWVPREKGDKP